MGGGYCDDINCKCNEPLERKEEKSNVEVVKAPYIAAKEKLKERLTLQEAMKMMPSNVLVSPTPVEPEKTQDEYIEELEILLTNEINLHCQERNKNQKLKEELKFQKNLIETKVKEHAKDNEELTARIRDLERENAHLKEIVEHHWFNC